VRFIIGDRCPVGMVAGSRDMFQVDLWVGGVVVRIDGRSGVGSVTWDNGRVANTRSHSVRPQSKAMTTRFEVCRSGLARTRESTTIDREDFGTGRKQEW
jgi:hypothetical protein